MATSEHTHFVVISRLDRLDIYNAQSGQKSAEVKAPRNVARFTGVAAAETGIYFASCQGAKGESLIARMHVSVQGAPSDLTVIDASGGDSIGTITGNTISASPGASQIIFVTSSGHIAAAATPATYGRFITAGGVLESATSEWPGQISSLSWSGDGDKLAFMWRSGAHNRAAHTVRESVSAPDFGVRTCLADAADLPAASDSVAPTETQFGDLSCPVLSSSGMSVYAIAKTNSGEASGLRPRVRLLRFPLSAGKVQVVADDIEVASTGEFVRLCRDTDDSALMLFERRRVSRLELASGIHTELVGTESEMIIASAAW